MMIESWRKKCTLKQLSLGHDSPNAFVTSQWQKEATPSVLYLIYRWLLALIFFVSLVMSIVDLKHPDADGGFRAKWLIYLTNWGYTVCTIQALLGAFMLSGCVLAARFRNQPNLQKNALKTYKLYWLTNTIGTDIAFGITTLYWSLIYNAKTMDLDAINYLLHANNSVLMMIDLFMVSHPIRLLHCCYPVVFGLCYALFSVIFYAAGGISREGNTYIYNILDWDKPGSTALVSIAVIGFIVIVHIITWCLHQLRGWIHAKCFPDNKSISSQDQEQPAKVAAYDNEAMATDLV